MSVAKETLHDPVFQDAIQFMNEQVVQDLANTDPLDTNTLSVLRLRLGVISEFPQVLAQFIDEYEQIETIRAEQARRDKQTEEAA